MLRRLSSILTIFTLVILSFVVAPKTYAATPVLPPAITPIPTPTGTGTGIKIKELDEILEQDGSLDKALKEFCEKRSGTQMNLETWYSGKCTDDTFRGEGVGFADIVILDLAEKISGKKDPNKTFSQTLKDVFQFLKDNGDTGLIEARQQFFASQNNGLLGQGSSLIATLYQYQPASTQSYFAHINTNLQKHKVIPSALAASNGIGFDTFSPFLPIWIAVRNLAYLGLVAFFIIYGFMMMFRVNLGQKTVISVQLAIPKLIVTLLIITFSYAIVGLVFDLMYVVIYFIFGYLNSQGLITTGASTWNPASAASGFGKLGMIGSMFTNSIVAAPAAVIGVLNLVLGGFATAAVILPIIIPGTAFLISLIISIAVLISYGKLFLKLIGSFISIVISLITAPLVLLGNAFPGSSAIGNWFRSIVANVAVFPVTIILLLFSYMFMIQPILGLCTSTFGLIFGAGKCEDFFGVVSLVPTGSTHVYNIPLIGPHNAIGGSDGRAILALLGLGLLLMASKYVDIIKDALKVPPFKYGSGIGKALESGLGGAKAVGEFYDSTQPSGTPPSNLTRNATKWQNRLKTIKGI